MAIRDIFRVSRKTFFNPSQWLDWDAIKEQNRTVIDIIRSLFTPPRPLQEESFEQAMGRLGLTEEDVSHIATNYHSYALIFVLLSLVVFIYSLYLLFRYAAILDMLIGIGVIGLFLSQAFKYDFWALQMRRRQLGLTFKDWKNTVLGIKEPPA